MSKPLIKRTITAGPLVMVALYPAASSKDGTTARQKKRELSTRAQQLMNLKYAWQKLKLLIAANFGPKDLFLTLTYTDECLPSDRDQVKRDVAAFVKSLRRHRPGQELRYIYCIEHKHGEGRWHVHMLLNSTGEDFDLILRLWKRGGVEFKKIRVDREKNYESLARYFCKEPRDKPGDCLWSGSKNLRKPLKTFQRAEAGEVLRPPPENKTVYRNLEKKETTYGDLFYMEYVLRKKLEYPEAVRRRRKKSKRFY